MTLSLGKGLALGNNVMSMAAPGPGALYKGTYQTTEVPVRIRRYLQQNLPRSYVQRVKSSQFIPEP